MHDQNVTYDDIMNGLAEVGLREGDVVLVHSSLSAFGWVDGGADVAIDALLDTVGAAGTVVVPTFTWGPFRNQPRVTFDLQNTPVKDEVGIIAETFRQRPEAQRSTHIVHSVAAIGPDMGNVMGEGKSSFGHGSTFHQLYGLDAWCLLVGVDFSSCTQLHACEEYMQVPYRYYRSYAGSTVILPDGTEMPSQSVEYLCYAGFRNDFGKMRQVLDKHGVLNTAQVGKATVTNVRIRDIFHTTVDYMKDNIGFLLTEDSQKLLEAAPSGAVQPKTVWRGCGHT
ncbi:MAG: aminoglycoside N(3)-acetyltransferase [Armatimonadota bacterium]